jgi:Leucine-rich repeat (LRR) protein
MFSSIRRLVLTLFLETLQVLNLAFNCLGSKDLEELSNLLRIRELYLGSNRIRSLPPIMDRFSRLETLSLESNNISGQEVFNFLAIMPRLRNLNLSYNKITGFPEVRPSAL